MTANVQSLQRCFSILYAVAGRPDGRSVREIAASCGLKPVTAYKLVRTLEKECLLKRTGPPIRYVLGHAIHELHLMEQNRLLITEAGLAFQKAQLDLPEGNYALLQWDDGETYQRVTVEAATFGRIVYRREYRVHSYAKASSMLFLAYASPEDEANFYRKHPFEEEGASVWKDRPTLDDFLARVRRIERSMPKFPDNVYVFYRVALPVWSPGGGLIAAVAGFIKEKHPIAHRRLLVQQCETIAKNLTNLQRSNLLNLPGTRRAF